MQFRSTRARSHFAPRLGLSYAGLSCAALASVLCQLACNAFDDPDVSRNRRLVPTDTRPAIQAHSPPPPLSGGTVSVTRDGRYAAVADEARDRLSIVDLTRGERIGDVPFEPGSRPGRVVEGEPGTVYVVLREAGAVASVRVSDATLLAQSDVCAAPRGIAYAAASEELYVACASGRFLTLSSAGQITRSVLLPNDLRDVVVEHGNVWVSRFRSAEVLRLDAEGAIVERSRPPALALPRRSPDGLAESLALFEPGVGWRLTAHPNAGVVLVHQRATTEEIVLTPTENAASPYGSGGGCSDGIQRSSVTSFEAGGKITPWPPVGVTLPVDIALLADGKALIVGAGREDANAPRSSFVSLAGGASFGSAPSLEFGRGGAASIATLVSNEPLGCSRNAELFGDADLSGAAQYTVGVAARPLSNGAFVIQTREPAQLLVVSAQGNTTAIELSGDSVADTGFDLFHRNAEAGISCASCHPDGSDDGHVWSFEGHGLRRTQPLDAGLAGTAPFHWDGSLREVGELMGEVFVSRMGGVHESSERLEALERWLFDLSPPAPETPVDALQVDRGRGLFGSLELGCADCHRGESFTDNNNYDVGTGEPGEKFQVPSLIGVGTRSRLIHDGCANSLRERFELACAGGDRHGKVSLLDEADIDDLVAYLETL